MQLHGGNLRQARERYGRDNFIDLSANINPFGPPEGVLEHLGKGLSEIIHYPDPESLALRSRMTELYRIPLERIILGNGAGELLFTMLHVFKPRRVLIPVPSFSEYRRAAEAVGAEITYIVLGSQGWEGIPALESRAEAEEFGQDFRKALSGQDLLFLCSPHNPTGTTLSPRQFEVLLDAALESHCRVVYDESFVDFLPDAKRWSARKYLDRYPNLTVLYSLTKFYSLPGLRLGAAFGQAEDIVHFTRVRDPWSVNVMAQQAGLAVLHDPLYAQRVRGKLAESRAYLFSQFEQRQFGLGRLLQTEVNFALLRLNQGDSGALTQSLGERGILVRDCSDFQGLEGAFIRLAIKDIPDMERLLAALQAIDH